MSVTANVVKKTSARPVTPHASNTYINMPVGVTIGDIVTNTRYITLYGIITESLWVIGNMYYCFVGVAPLNARYSRKYVQCVFLNVKMTIKNLIWLLIFEIKR